MLYSNDFEDHHFHQHETSISKKEEHHGGRIALRIIGSFLILGGFSLIIFALTEFFGDTIQDHFYFFFVGAPAIFLGIVMICMSFFSNLAGKITKPNIPDTIHKTKVCPYCKEPNLSSAEVCVKCGRTFTKADKTCPECGTLNDPEATFCKTCGKML